MTEYLNNMSEPVLLGIAFVLLIFGGCMCHLLCRPTPKKKDKEIGGGNLIDYNELIEKMRKEKINR